MTEPIFKAPLPPENKEFPEPQNSLPSEQVNGQQSQAQPESPSQPKMAVVSDLKQKIVPYFWYALGGCFLMGLVCGLMMSSGSSTAPEAPKCLLQHIRNPDIQKRLPLCGRVAKVEPCVLYIMNTGRREVKAADFFSRARELTERSLPVIQIENAIYENYIIPPGYFAEIQIPAIR